MHYFHLAYNGHPVRLNNSADKERGSIPISVEEAAEVEPIALRFVICHEARSSRGVELAIVAAQGVMQLANLGVGDLIAFGPHHADHHLEQSEGTAQTSGGPDWEGGARLAW